MLKPIKPDEECELTVFVNIPDIFQCVADDNISIYYSIVDYIRKATLDVDESKTESEIVLLHNKMFDFKITKITDILENLINKQYTDWYCDNENYSSYTNAYLITLFGNNKNYESEMIEYEKQMVLYNKYKEEQKLKKKVKSQQYKETRSKLDGDRLVMIKDILYPFVQSHNLPFTIEELNKGLAKYKQAVQIYNTLNTNKIRDYK